MKQDVNGKIVELEADPNLKIEKVGDRWLVRTPGGTKSALVVRQGNITHVSFQGRTYRVSPPQRRREGESAVASGSQRAPLPGQVVEVLVAEGESVTAGQRLVVVEAMKMQQPIAAPFDGIVRQLPVRAGDKVSEGDLLVEVSPHE